MCISLLQGWGVPDFKETTRDTHTFSRRVGTLPEQREGDEMDYRPLLHRWVIYGGSIGVWTRSK
jgi:hypothetical protein